MAKLIRAEYLQGSCGEVALIEVDGRFVVQWGAYVDDNGEFCDSGYTKYVFKTLEEAMEHFEHYYRW